MLGHASALFFGTVWWRAALFGAVALTVLAIAFPPGGSSPSPASGQNSYVSRPANALPPSPSGGAPAASGASIGASIPAPAAIDPNVQGRLDRFQGVADAQGKEPNEAPRCERLAEAVSKLEPGDTGAAQPNTAKSLTAAWECRSKIDASDARFDDLLTRARAAREDGSLAQIEGLAAAFKALTPFDLSRRLSADRLEGIAAGRSAQEQLGASDKRIADLVAAAPGSLDGAARGAQNALVGSLQKITDRDVQRMSADQKDILAAGRRVAERLAVSDSRIAAALSAYDDVRQVEDAKTKMRLIAALGQVTPGDRDRATEAQRNALVDAAGLAKTSALSLAVDAAADFERSPSLPAHQQVAALMAPLAAVDRSTLTDVQRHALAVADKAALQLRESDRRIAALDGAIARWNKDQSFGAGARVDDALRAMTDLDRERFTPEQRQVYGQAESVHLVVASKTTSLTSQTRKQIPLYVAAANPTAPYASKFKAALRGASYKLVADRSSAALVLELEAEILSQGPRQIGNSIYEGARTQVDLRSSWALDHSDFYRGSAQGGGGGSTADIAVTTSYENAALVLFKQFDSFVDRQEKP